MNRHDCARLFGTCALTAMLTEDAEKMLVSLNRSSEKGAILGGSVWGDKKKNNFFGAIRETLIETGN